MAIKRLIFERTKSQSWPLLHFEKHIMLEISTLAFVFGCNFVIVTWLSFHGTSSLTNVVSIHKSIWWYLDNELTVPLLLLWSSSSPHTSILMGGLSQPMTRAIQRRQIPTASLWKTHWYFEFSKRKRIVCGNSSRVTTLQVHVFSTEKTSFCDAYLYFSVSFASKAFLNGGIFHKETKLKESICSDIISNLIRNNWDACSIITKNY